jgi:hypothetical protein
MGEPERINPKANPDMQIKPPKQPWIWPLNHFQEEWPEVVKAKWSFVLCCIVCSVGGVLMTVWLYTIFLLPGLQNQISDLKAKNDETKNYPTLLEERNALKGQTNLLFCEKEKLLDENRGLVKENVFERLTISNLESNVNFLSIFETQAHLEGYATPHNWEVDAGSEYSAYQYEKACGFWSLIDTNQPFSSEQVKNEPLRFHSELMVKRKRNIDGDTFPPEALESFRLSILNFTIGVRDTINQKTPNDNRADPKSLEDAIYNFNEIRKILPEDEANFISQSISNIQQLENTIRK